MAELASGAIHSLLGVIRDEAQLLGRLESDVQFIKEEMESMNSFLRHLARTTPPDGEHDEQVRTWMKQVRDLAYACSTCIDLYLQRGDPKVHRARGPLGYVWWVPWYLQMLFAQHRAATQLRELKARARDVGKRRLRYGVQIPGKSGDKDTTTTLAPITKAASSAPITGEDDDSRTRRDSDDRRVLALAEPRILEECTQKLLNWLLDSESISNEDRFRSIAIAAPDEEDGADVAREALARPSVATKFEHKLCITVPSFRPATPMYILEEILGELLPESGEGEWAKIEELDRKIEEIVWRTEEHLQAAGIKRPPRVVPLEPLDILCDILQELLPGHVKSVGKDRIENKINETAMKIKDYLEKLDKRRSWIGLDHSDYVGILRELLPRPKEDKPVKRATDTLGDDQIAKNIREITNKIKVDILRELLPKPQEDRSLKEDMDRSSEDHIQEKIKETTEKIIVNMLREMLPKQKEDMDKLDEDQRIEDITDKIKRILENIKEHLLVKEIANKIKEHIEGKRTIIVLDGINYVRRWEVTIWALSKMGCAAGSAVIVTTNHTQGVSQYCNPTRDPIEYSLVGFYHDKAVRLTDRLVNEDPNYNASIYRDILKNYCEPHELCMKLFVRALYANPKRSNEELEKLRDTLAFRGQLETNARKMIKFSYSDLPRDYKTCFLYLAIFPQGQGQTIKRSTLVGRWVAEGLVTEEGWPSSVHRAERCFDALIERLLVYPGDIGAAGKVKSCIVHDIVREFITKIARKEHFVDTRLSHHLAYHFSVLSDVRLHSSDSIEQFLKKLYRIPQLPLVKVLDLEGCKTFKKHYLENICKKMLLLKYLSLRNTDITKLPREINNLHQLEVLDIRHTRVMTASATKDLVLLKLKRLLSGCIHPSPCDDCVRHKSFSAAQLPHRIGKMTNMEVLSHVEASQRGAELKDIGKLWQLRKLGVVIRDKKAHLKNLVHVIGDLSESLQSLSISIKPLQASGQHISFEKPPKLLESLSISGTSGQLLPSLVEHCDKLAKVTLHNTHLNQDNMKDLGQLAKFRCLRLRHKSYTESKLTFKKEEFQNLKYLLVEGSNMTDISFEDGAATLLEKIVLSSIEMDNISFGHGAAPKLNEIALSSTNITSITFENGATPNLKKIIFGDTVGPQLQKIVLPSTITGITFKNGAAPKLEEIILSSTNITGITFENGAAPNLRKIVLSFTNVEFLSGINYLPVLMELELNGSVIGVAVRSLFTDAKQLAKVTLRDTLLKQADLQILLAKQPNLCFLMLLDKSCDERQLTFSKEEFRNLKLLVVECFGITEISFAEGAAPNLNKIAWSFTNMESLSGIDNLLELKELEFKGDKIPNPVWDAIKKHPNFLVLKVKHTQQKNQDKEEEAQQQWILDSN